MFKDSRDKIIDLRRVFLEPSNPTHRQYEALRAYFVEGLPSAEAARRFGYTPGSFRVLVHHFRHHPHRSFFVPPAKGPHAAPKADPLRERVIALRKQNLSIYDISRALDHAGHPLSPVAVSLILKEEGFARLPRRRDEERPLTPHPEIAPVADLRQLDLSPRQLRTQFAGLFLFVPYLSRLPLDEMLDSAHFPGSRMIPAAAAVRSLLALKLLGQGRPSHVMSQVMDEGLALFAGLNVIPKRSFLTEYSCRIPPAAYPEILRLWFEAVSRLGLPHGQSFDLDFHTIPFHGEDALLEKHYVSKRSRRQKGMLAFLVHDAQRRVLCYANAQVRKADQRREILRFVEFWKARSGALPGELIFDSQLTTYAHLNELNARGIAFVTLRRRHPELRDQIRATPLSAWRKIELPSLSRQYRMPRILDQRIRLHHYDGEIRQIIAADLGHEEPTVLLTNQLKASPAALITRYAQRMLVENAIQDGIDFFHMDALSSAVAMKVSCDLQLTLMGSSLYRLLGLQVGQGYETAKSRHIFRDLVSGTGLVDISDAEIRVRFHKRAHNPLLTAGGFHGAHGPVPWLGNKILHLDFGS